MPPHTSVTRRALLQATALGGLGALVAGSPAEAAAVPAPVTASWVIQENQRAGTRAWVVGAPAPAGRLEAFASATSVAQV